VRYAAIPDSAILPGSAPLIAFLNGRSSGDPCRVERLRPDARVESHGLSGLTRGDRGLALAFESGEPGEGRIAARDGSIEVASLWQPPRPVFPQGDGGTLRIACDPAGDGLSALRALWAPASPVDLERLTAVAAPAGWRSRYAFADGLTEDAVIANLEHASRVFDRRQLGLFQVDDGYQRSLGDWDANTRFPHGHRWLTDRIHAHGRQAGVWVAPFAVAERSGIPEAHPEWLLRREGAPAVLAARESWGGRVYGLDAAHPAVQEWLFALGRRLVRDWGYDHVEVDLLDAATAGDAHAGGLTRAEAYRRGLAALRDGLGADTFLHGGGAPLQHAAGLVNGMRVGPEVAPSWGAVQGGARAATLRSFYHRAVWLNDHDGLLVRSPLTEAEARAWTTVTAMAGGRTMLADDLPSLPPDRLALVQRALPPAHGAGRPVDGLREDRDVAPAVTNGDAVHPIAGTWRFRTGDDAAYAAPGYDDSVWETIAIPGTWEAAGRPDYDGFAWYRIRFQLPTAGSSDPLPARLELGKLDDADDAFVNGTMVGTTNDRAAYRRYALPAGTLNWGGENVLAIRVFDAGGAGGWWTARRDRPGDVWIREGRPEWWTIALLNWDDERRRVTLPLARAGIAGTRFAVYDVWGGDVLPDVTGNVVLDVEPHDARVVALRPASERPAVVGTTRHVVQGALDIATEEWDAATRRLHVRSHALDSRPYQVTVAVPRGLVPVECVANVACTMRRQSGQTGPVALAWPGGAPGREIDWTLRFRSARSPNRGR
jgi:hypothetical protein